MTRRSTLVLLLLIVAVFAAAAPASAQAPTAYNLALSNQGAPAPFTTAILPASAFTCGATPKVPPITTVAVNAFKVIVNDPANPLADCLYADPGPSNPIVALPFGPQVYTATISASNAVGPSADSLVSNPFSRPGAVPPVPTGLRISR